ncbi:MAG: hypothetical protein R3357_06055, partial [Burkholderiales bacterium]|nr:hypothetical protein [Burkholderiales bacterium]
RCGGWDAAHARWRALCARHPEDAPSRWRLRHCQAAIERRTSADAGFVAPMAALGLALPAIEA